ncbi:MAG: hypothetical protein HQM10_22425 [Candidatus Riflebacteria bacterium]|nr:hypothetical protein [Candidatus Riflebacteria bacterium]
MIKKIGNKVFKYFLIVISFIALSASFIFIRVEVYPFFFSLNQISAFLEKLSQIKERLSKIDTFDGYLNELNKNKLVSSDISEKYLKRYFENESNPAIGFFGKDYISKSLEKKNIFLATEAIALINSEESDFFYQVVATRDFLKSEKSINEKIQILIKTLESPKKHFVFNNFSTYSWFALFEMIENLFLEDSLKEGEKAKIKRALIDAVRRKEENAFFPDLYRITVFGDIYFLYLINFFDRFQEKQTNMIPRIKDYISFQNNLLFFKKVNKFFRIVDIPEELNFLIRIDFAEKILTNILNKEKKKVFNLGL